MRVGWEMVGDISYDKPTLQLLHKKKYSLTGLTNLALMQLDVLEKHLGYLLSSQRYYHIFKTTVPNVTHKSKQLISCIQR